MIFLFLSHTLYRLNITLRSIMQFYYIYYYIYNK